MELQNIPYASAHRTDDDVRFLIDSYNNAVKYLRNDPMACLTSSRRIAEDICKSLLKREITEEHEETRLAKFIQALKKENIVPYPILAALHAVREYGNVGAHSQGADIVYITTHYAQPCIQSLAILTDWYVNHYQPTRAFVFTTGPTVRLHLEAAWKRLHLNLNIAFNTQSKDIKEHKLLELCRTSATHPHPTPYIFIFSGIDPAIAIEVSEPDQAYKVWGNNVFSVVLPVPSHRSHCKAVSIELYYRDDEITQKAPDNKRLFLSSEFDHHTGICHHDPKIRLRELKEFQELVTRSPETIVDNAYVVVNEYGQSVTMKRASFAEYITKSNAPFHDFNIDAFRPLFEILAEILRVHKPTHLTRKRRVDTAVPKTCTLDRSIELRVQVRFVNAPLLGTEEWIESEQLSQIQKQATPVSVNFPIDSNTGQLQETRLIIRIISQDFDLHDMDSEKIVSVPPDEFSPVLTFLLIAKHSGLCHLKVEVCNAENHVLGDIPLEITVETMTIPPDKFPEFVYGGALTLANQGNGHGESDITSPDSSTTSIWAENLDSMFKLTQHYLNLQENRGAVTRVSEKVLLELDPEHADDSVPLIPAFVNRQARGQIKPVKNHDVPGGFGEADDSEEISLIRAVVPIVIAVLSALFAEHKPSPLQTLQKWLKNEQPDAKISKTDMLEQLTIDDVGTILKYYGITLPQKKLDALTQIIKREVREYLQQHHE